MSNANIAEIIRAVAPAFLAANARTYKYRVMELAVHHNMLGAEVMPKPIKGEIVARRDGWYIQKEGRSLFVAHPESLIPETLQVGDKVEIQYPGFVGTEVRDMPSASGGVVQSLSRAQLRCPVENEYLRDLTQQLSEMKFEKDGRRGLHLLSDLNYANFRATAPDDETNPFVEFEVAGAKFQGTVRILYVLGGDYYEMSFIKDGETVKFIDDVYFEDLLPFLEDTCDSSEARKVKVTFTAKRKKAPATAAA